MVGLNWSAIFFGLFFDASSGEASYRVAMRSGAPRTRMRPSKSGRVSPDPTGLSTTSISFL